MGRQEENCQHQNLEYGTHVEKKPQNQFFFSSFCIILALTSVQTYHLTLVVMKQ